MGALLEQFAAAGVTLTTLPGGHLHAAGPLTDGLRTAIRAHKPAILAELAAANDATTPEQAAELRALVARIAATWSARDRGEALAVALADPADALICFRALVADIEPAPAPAGPYTARPLAERAGDDRRTCADCTHLSAIGRCLAAARGAANTDAGRSGIPIDDLLRRCAGYAPGPDDHDRRSGAERWPCMVADAARVRALATEVRNK